MGARRIWISALGVSGGDAFAECLEATHSLPGRGLPANHERVRLDPASYLVSCPALPEGPPVVAGGAEGFIAGQCLRTVFVPGADVLADQECGQDCHRSEGMPERGGLSDDDRRMAAAGVARAIGRHPADPLTLAIPPGNCGSTGPSRSLPGVNSTARMSGLAVSMARRAFRVCRPRCKTFPSQWAGPRTAIFCQAFFSGLSLPLGGMVIRGAGPQSCARALRLRCICRFSTSRSLRSLPVLVVDVLGSTILAYCDAVWGGRHPPSCATALHLRPMPAGLALPHHRGP